MGEQAFGSREIAAVVGVPLPVVWNHYESEDGKRAFDEWKAKKEISDSAST